VVNRLSGEGQSLIDQAHVFKAIRWIPAHGPTSVDWFVSQDFTTTDYSTIQLFNHSTS
jgi:hypothetical protein